MIDLMTMNKTGLTDTEILQIVEKNDLKTHSKDGVIYYDNQTNKTLNDGFFIRIETDKKRLKLECSLHKYYNWILNRKQTNDDLFSFSNASNSVDLLTDKTGIDVLNLKVSYYEIGLNLYMDCDCKTYIDNMQTIGTLDNKRQLFVNPRYKGERIKTTVFHRHIKKVFKVYDKNHEMRDKQRNFEPLHPYILRIETIQKRVEKMTVSDLLNPRTIQKLTDQFLKDWRTVQFTPNIEAPKGTHRRKIDLAIQILLFGKEQTLSTNTITHKSKGLTDKQFRNAREFIVNEWDMFKETIKVTKAPIELEFRDKINELLKTVKQ